MSALTTSHHAGTSAIRELAEGVVIDYGSDATSRPNPYADGYGDAIPTCYWVKLTDNRKRRVYVVAYGNSGSAYVNVTEDGVKLRAYLPSDVEHTLLAL